MAGSLASINIRFKVDLSEFSTQLQNTVRSIEKTGQKMQSIGSNMSTFVTLPLLAGGAASIKFASDAEESMNKVNVAFGDSAGTVKGFAKTTLDSFGIAESSALDMASLFGDMATSMSITRPEAAKMSTSLVGLAGDLSSFKNIGIDEATTALNGIFTGETESLKRLGVVMTEANLAQFAMSQGITKQIKNMSQAEKVQLRYNYVMEQTKNAHGDFERTGGGAANQMRTFGEVMKEIGAAFGEIILPYFTSFITYINDLLKKFRDLDSGTKTIIVVIAGLAAAIGPLLFAIGGILAAVPLMVSGFAAVKGAVMSLSATIAANPLGAFLIVLGAVASALLISKVRFGELTNAEKEFSEVTSKATDSIAKEKVQMDQYLVTAKNDKLSKEERQAAIKKLNELSPEYLGNLTLETINTDSAKKATDLYVASLITKAKVMAAQEKLVGVQKQLLDLQMGQNDAIKPSLWQELANRFLSVGDAGRYAILNTQTLGENLATENSELLKLQGMLTAFIQENNKFADSNEAAADSVEEVNNALAKGPEAGSVAFYQGQISALEKFRDEHKITAKEYSEYYDKIAAIQKKIDDIQGKRPQLEAVVPEMAGLQDSPELKKIKDIEALIATYKQLQQTQVEGSAQWKAYEQVIKDAEANIAKIKLSVQVDPEPVLLLGQTVTAVTGKTKEEIEELQATATAVSGGFSSAWDTLSGNFIDSMGEAESGLARFGKVMMQTVLKLIGMALSQALANSIVGATQTGNAGGPLAAFTTPAFIATAVGGIFAAFAAIPKFETGGMVGGNSFYGDKILARVNSGELILNQKQQQSLYGALDGSGQMVNIGLDGSFKISGSDLELVIDRAIERNNRKR